MNDNFEDDIIIEETYEKDRSRGNKIRTDWKKAISRFNLMKSISRHLTDHSLGYYRNNNEANANTYMKRKTKTRKASASYRHKGGYGEANKYSPHDERQIDSMNDDLVED